MRIRFNLLYARANRTYSEKKQSRQGNEKKEVKENENIHIGIFCCDSRDKVCVKPKHQQYYCNKIKATIIFTSTYTGKRTPIRMLPILTTLTQAIITNGTTTATTTKTPNRHNEMRFHVEKRYAAFSCDTFRSEFSLR